MPRLSVVRVKSFSLAKAWLLGFLAGDGGFDLSCSPRVTANLGDSELVDHVIRAFEDCYEGVRAIAAAGLPSPEGSETGRRKKVYHTVRCNQRMVVDDIMSYGKFGIDEWEVPNFIISSSEEMKAAWLRGYFDADGFVIHDQKVHARYVQADSVNEKALRQVSSLLSSIGIQHSWHAEPAKGNDSPSFNVRVSYHEDLTRFATLVGFASLRKTALLAAAQASRQRFPVRKSLVVSLTPEIKKRRESGETTREIAEAVGLKKGTVDALCRRFKIQPGEGGKGRTNRKRGTLASLLPEILRLQDEGLDGTEIAKRVGLKDRKAVNDVVKYWGRKKT